MSATGEAPRRKKGGAVSRPCACGCGVCTREFGLQLTVRRTQGGDRDLLKPLLGSMSKENRQRIRKALAQGQPGGYISAVHVHPDDLFWTDGLQISLKKEGPLRVSSEPLTVRPTQRGAPLRTTTYARETFGSGRLESPATVRGFDDSARRRRTAAAHSTVGVAPQTESERRARTPATRGKSKKACQRHDKSTPVAVAVDQVLQKPGPVRHITFDDEDDDASEMSEDETACLRRELDEARVALRLVEESRTSYKQRYIEAKKAQARESHARESVLEMFRSRNDGHLTFRRLLTDEKLRKACNALTGWRTPETFEALWRYVDGGKKRWSDRCNLWHESKDARATHHRRVEGRVLKMEDAFFLFWFIAKTGVDRGAAGYLFGIEPATVTRYWVTMTAFLDEFLQRKFPRMADYQIYFTQDPDWANVIGQPVHSIIDATEVPMEVSRSRSAAKLEHSTYKGGATVKFNIGLAANGLVDYISDAIGGNASDKQMCLEHGHLEAMTNVASLCVSADGKPAIPVILADKGYTNVVGAYLDRGIKIITPTYKNLQVDFNDADLAASMRISSKRVHIERANGQAKVFKYLTTKHKILSVDHFGREFRVIYMFATNYRPSLCHRSLESFMTQDD